LFPPITKYFLLEKQKDALRDKPVTFIIGTIGPGWKIFLTLSRKTMEHIPPSPLFHKPASIVAAINILYAGLFLSILNWALGWWTTTIFDAAPAQSIVTLVVTVGITFALIKCIGLGRKWARVVLLVLFLLGLVVYAWAFAALLKASIVAAVLSLLLTSLQIIALYFLFSRASTQWFNRVREKARDEPSIQHLHRNK
jgi:hypothetical protein